MTKVLSSLALISAAGENRFFVDSPWDDTPLRLSLDRYKPVHACSSLAQSGLCFLGSHFMQAGPSGTVVACSRPNPMKTNVLVTQCTVFREARVVALAWATPTLIYTLSTLGRGA